MEVSTSVTRPNLPKSEVPLSGFLRLFFFVSGFFSDLPILAAYHYDEKGYARKAEQCRALFRAWYPIVMAFGCLLLLIVLLATILH